MFTTTLNLGYTCRIDINFGTQKDRNLFINILASSNCLSYRNIFQNGIDAKSKTVDAFLSKSSKSIMQIFSYQSTSELWTTVI